MAELQDAARQFQVERPRRETRLDALTAQLLDDFQVSMADSAAAAFMPDRDSANETALRASLWN